MNKLCPAYSLTARSRRRVWGWVLMMLVTVSGCGPLSRLDSAGAELALRSRDRDGAVLTGPFATALYSFDDRNHLTVVLIDGPEEQPTRALTMRMYWQPRAGHTPIDATATNATLHYLIFTGPESSEVGVYGGAGFVYPRQRPGRAALTLGVWDSNLRLIDRSAGFTDLLGQAVLTGRFQVRRDDVAVQRLLRRLDQRASQALGYPRMVWAR